MKKSFKECRFVFVITIVLLLVFVGTLFFSNYMKLKHEPVVRTNSTTEVKEPASNKIASGVLKSEVNVEINSSLPDIKEFFNDMSNLNDFPTIKYFKDKKEVSVDLTSLDTYEVEISYQEKVYYSTLNIVDTTPPKVTLKELSLKEGHRYLGRNFIQTYNDNSKNKNYTVSFKDQSYSDITAPGTYDIALQVCDSSNNCTDGSTKLFIFQYNSQKKYLRSEDVTEILKEEPLKYGMKKVTSTEVTYALYDDGSKEEVSRNNETVDYDYSGFNHEYLSDMKKEATVLFDDQAYTRLDIIGEENNLRREKRLPDLTLDKKLSVLAIVRAMEIAHCGRFITNRPYKDPALQPYYTFWQESIFDYNYSYDSKIGENLGAKYADDQSMLNAWHSNVEQYQLITDADYRKTGIGKYTLNGTTYWVQLFIS